MARTSGRSAADTRRLILDAAARLIARHGAAASVSEIAAAAARSPARSAGANALSSS